MYKSNLLALAISCSLLGCDGDTCPTIAIPVYNITVYDSVTGKLLCQQQWGNEDHDCDITVTFSESDVAIADIVVSLVGYSPETRENVPNNRGKYRCFDQPSYTTNVDFHLNLEP